jgi:hypothetical protein
MLFLRLKFKHHDYVMHLTGPGQVLKDLNPRVLASFSLVEAGAT